MKVLSFFLATVLALAYGKQQQQPVAFTRGLEVRGGGELGPLDGKLAMQLSKTVATAYIAGSGAKYIASNTGGGGNQVRSYIMSCCEKK